VIKAEKKALKGRKITQLKNEEVDQ